MRFLGNGLKFGTSVAIGAGVVLLAPVVIPILGSIMKPLAKTAIKGGILAYEGMKVTLKDLAAEAKAEISQDRPSGPE